MIPQRLSKLSFYTLAIVLEDKKECSYMVKCWPLEDLPFTDGKVKDWNVKHDTVLPDVMGKVDSTAKSKAISEMWVKWISLSSDNRSTAPDVVANETIAIYKYADTEHYYWDTVFWDDKHRTFRKDEHVKHIYTNVKTPMTPKNDSNTYWDLISTKKKLVRWHTSKNDGEFTDWDFMLDTKEGVLCWIDNMGEMIQIRAKENEINITAKKRINFTAPVINLVGHVNVYNGIDVSGDVAATGNLRAGGSVLTSGCCCHCPSPPSLPDPPKPNCNIRNETCHPKEP